nr:MAG: CRISPR-associated endonuclease Cas1 3 [Bacteroidota bacterium]
MPQSYYIFRSGRLRRRQNTIYLECDDNGQVQKQPIPVENVRDLYLFGELDLNTRLLVFLAQQEIVVHCFNYYGFYVGSFYPREGNVSGHVLVRQVEHYLIPEHRLAIAREFVSGALFHMRHNLRYYQNRGRNLQEVIDGIEAVASLLDSALDVPTLMGLEGQARELYYRAFTDILGLEEPFEKRVRRPPNNPINALLSFGNTLLYTAVLSQIYLTQLNPTVSYLHEPSRRRFSLALDLAEVFKPLIVDRLIFRLWNRRMIQESDFEPIGQAEGLYLGERARKVFVREFEEMLATTVQHRRLNRAVSYRQLLRLEAYKLIRHLIGMEPYKALRAWW